MSSIVTRIVFVHGSVGNAQSTWSEQRALADRFECVFVTRSGYPPGPPLERIDFEEQADDVATELRGGDHLVGHSYGGVVITEAGTDPSARLVYSPTSALRAKAAIASFLAEVAEDH